MTYSSSAICMDINVFLHVSHYADAVDSCLGLFFEPTPHPTLLFQSESHPHPREVTIQMNLQKKT
jgi:hypothetical protein